MISRPFLISRPPLLAWFCFFGHLWDTFFPASSAKPAQPHSRAMSSTTGDTEPYAPVPPGAANQPPRTQPPRYFDPLARETNRPIRRPTLDFLDQPIPLLMRQPFRRTIPYFGPAATFAKLKQTF